MPLAACPDCRRAVSTAAPQCPFCGRPLASGSRSSAPPPVVTTQRTGKFWKFCSAVAMLGLICGLGALILGFNGQPAFLPWALILIPSVLLALFARLGAWWYHA